MAYSDDELQFDKDLLDALKQAQLDMAKSGGVKKVKKGDFQAEYRSTEELDRAIKRLQTSIYLQENGCPERKLCQ